MSLLDGKALLEKLRRIEALHAGATTPGERDAAENAIRHIRQRLRLVEQQDPPTEYQFTMADAWSHKLFMALARGVSARGHTRDMRVTAMAVPCGGRRGRPGTWTTLPGA